MVVSSLEKNVFLHQSAPNRILPTGRKRDETELPELTTLLVFGEAPWWINWCTMLSCPMNAATWIGVRPDCEMRKTHGGREKYIKGN